MVWIEAPALCESSRTSYSPSPIVTAPVSRLYSSHVGQASGLLERTDLQG